MTMTAERQTNSVDTQPAYEAYQAPPVRDQQEKSYRKAMVVSGLAACALVGAMFFREAVSDSEVKPSGPAASVTDTFTQSTLPPNTYLQNQNALPTELPYGSGEPFTSEAETTSPSPSPTDDIDKPDYPF